ncbi:MAG: aquaporin [Thermoanaerobaculia bacterium]|nr:aquaporin [Thermoanaerobaculia bacterium]
MNKYLVEFLGTFFLVLTVGLAAGLGLAGNLAPLAIGSVLMVMIYAGGHVSGAHYNPAVTLAVYLRGKCPASDIPGYVAAQLVGAVVAALTVGVLSAETMSSSPLDTVPALLAEFLFTFGLCWVILNVATAKANEGNSHYGLAIGFTVMAGAFAVGSISGGVFNPAVAVGISVMGLAEWASIWIYLAAQLAAGIAAAFAFKAIVGD